MKKIIFTLLKQSSFTFYKRMLALVLAFVMLFNLGGEAFANVTSLGVENKSEIKKLQEELLQMYAEQEMQESAASKKSLKEKMKDAKERYVVALVKYQLAAQLPLAFNQIGEKYLEVSKELEAEQKGLEAEKTDLDNEYNSEKMAKYNQKTPGYVSWQKREASLAKSKSAHEEEIKKLNGEITILKGQIEKASKIKAKKIGKEISAKEEEIATAKREIGRIESEIKEKSAKWAWYEDEKGYIENNLEARKDAYNERAEHYNSKLERMDEDARIVGEKSTWNKILREIYGTNEGIPEGMGLEECATYEEVKGTYNEKIKGTIEALWQEYNISAMLYENAAKAYYDDLMYRYEGFETDENNKQCELTKKVLEKRQEGLEDVDEWGWQAIKWLSKDQKKNSTPSGIKEALLMTWNTCGTGLAITKSETLLSSDFAGLKNKRISAAEYVDVKFYEYYEEYLKENEKHYDTQVKANAKDITKVQMYAPYSFKPNKQSDYEEGLKRGREMFMLLLTNHELGYAMYRMSVVKSHLASQYIAFLKDEIDAEEKPIEIEDPIEEEVDENGVKIVTVRGYKMPKYYYNLYLKYDGAKTATKVNTFVKARRVESYARGELYRLAGKVVKDMYLEGKSLGEVLNEVGITQGDINKAFEKYKAALGKETVMKEKASLANDLEFRDYSSLIGYEVREKFKKTTFDKVLDGVFFWLPSNWMPIERDEVTGRRMSMQAKHELDMARAEAIRLERYAQIHKNRHFKDFLYVLAENTNNWSKYLLPIANRINEERQDIETASILGSLATGLKGNLDIKEDTLIAERNTGYQLQGDPFYIVKTFIFDTITIIGITKVIQVLGVLARTARVVSQGAKAARATTPVARSIGKVKAPKEMPRVAPRKVGRPAASGQNSGLAKVREQIKLQKQASLSQSKEAQEANKAAREAENAAKRAAREKQAEMEQEAQEVIDSLEGKYKVAEVKAPTLLDRIKRAWATFRLTSNMIWRTLTYAPFSVPALGAVGGEAVAPVVAIEQTVIADRAASELTYVVGEVAQEGKVAGEIAGAAKEGQLLGEAAGTARETRSAVEAARGASEAGRTQRSLWNALDFYSAIHLHKGLDFARGLGVSYATYSQLLQTIQEYKDYQYKKQLSSQASKVNPQAGQSSEYSEAGKAARAGTGTQEEHKAQDLWNILNLYNTIHVVTPIELQLGLDGVVRPVAQVGGLNNSEAVAPLWEAQDEEELAIMYYAGELSLEQLKEYIRIGEAMAEQGQGLTRLTHPLVAASYKRAVSGYNEMGKAMFLAGEKPVMGITHPLVIAGYERAAADPKNYSGNARQAKESTTNTFYSSVEAAYPNLTKEELSNYINLGEAMYAAGEKPVVGITHPVVTLSYQRASVEAAQKKVQQEMMYKMLSQFNQRASRHTAVAAMSIIPFLPIGWLVGGTIGPRMSAKKQEALREIIKTAIAEETEALGEEEVNTEAFRSNVASRVTAEVEASDVFTRRQKRILTASISSMIDKTIEANAIEAQKAQVAAELSEGSKPLTASTMFNKEAFVENLSNSATKIKGSQKSLARKANKLFAQVKAMTDEEFIKMAKSAVKEGRTLPTSADYEKMLTNNFWRAVLDDVYLAPYAQEIVKSFKAPAPEMVGKETIKIKMQDFQGEVMADNFTVEVVFADKGALSQWKKINLADNETFTIVKTSNGAYELVITQPESSRGIYEPFFMGGKNSIERDYYRVMGDIQAGTFNADQSAFTITLYSDRAFEVATKFAGITEGLGGIPQATVAPLATALGINNPKDLQKNVSQSQLGNFASAVFTSLQKSLGLKNTLAVGLAGSVVGLALCAWALMLPTLPAKIAGLATGSLFLGIFTNGAVKPSNSVFIKENSNDANTGTARAGFANAGASIGTMMGYLFFPVSVLFALTGIKAFMALYGLAAVGPAIALTSLLLSKTYNFSNVKTTEAGFKGEAIALGKRLMKFLPNFIHNTKFALSGGYQERVEEITGEKDLKSHTEEYEQVFTNQDIKQQKKATKSMINSLKDFFGVKTKAALSQYLLRMMLLVALYHFAGMMFNSGPGAIIGKYIASEAGAATVSAWQQSPLVGAAVLGTLGYVGATLVEKIGNFVSKKTGWGQKTKETETKATAENTQEAQAQPAQQKEKELSKQEKIVKGVKDFLKNNGFTLGVATVFAAVAGIFPGLTAQLTARLDTTAVAQILTFFTAYIGVYLGRNYLSKFLKKGNMSPQSIIGISGLISTITTGLAFIPGLPIGVRMALWGVAGLGFANLAGYENSLAVDKYPGEKASVTMAYTLARLSGALTVVYGTFANTLAGQGFAEPDIYALAIPFAALLVATLINGKYIGTFAKETSRAITRPVNAISIQSQKDKILAEDAKNNITRSREELVTAVTNAVFINNSHTLRGLEKEITAFNKETTRNAVRDALFAELQGIESTAPQGAKELNYDRFMKTEVDAIMKAAEKQGLEATAISFETAAERVASHYHFNAESLKAIEAQIAISHKNMEADISFDVLRQLYHKELTAQAYKLAKRYNDIEKYRKAISALQKRAEQVLGPNHGWIPPAL